MNFYSTSRSYISSFTYDHWVNKYDHWVNKIIYIYCKGTFCSTVQKMDGQWPNESKTINLLEGGLETEHSMC